MSAIARYKFVIMFGVAVLLSAIISLAIQLSYKGKEPDPLPPIVVNDPTLQVEWAIAPRFSSYGRFKDGLVTAKLYGEIGYINPQGEFVIPLRFEDAYQFREGLARVKLDGKYGYIDKTGEFAIAPEFLDANDFHEGIAIVLLDHKPPIYAGIDQTGKILFELLPRTKAFYFSQGLAAIERDQQWGYIDKTGKLAIVPRFYAARQFSEDLAAVRLTRSIVNHNAGKWGFIERSGKVAIELPFESQVMLPNLTDFAEGLAIVRQNSQYGYIDKLGKVIIPAQFSLAYKFDQGLAVVWQNGKAGYIDRSGKFVIPPRFDWAYEFNEGLAGAAVDNKAGYIDKTGKFVIPPQFDLVFNFGENLAAVQIDGKFGYIRKSR
jgi:hypothetical protein